MPVRSASRTARLVSTRLVTGSQGHYLTVPSTFNTARAVRRSQPPWDGRNILCVQLCSCVAVVFLFCVLTVLVYSILLVKYSNLEPTISSDSLLAAVVKPEEASNSNNIATDK